MENTEHAIGSHRLIRNEINILGKHRGDMHQNWIPDVLYTPHLSTHHAGGPWIYEQKDIYFPLYRWENHRIEQEILVIDLRRLPPSPQSRFQP